MFHSISKSFIVCAAMIALAGCAKKTDSTMTDSSTATVGVNDCHDTATSAPATNPPGSSAMTDAQILGKMSTADSLEVANAKMLQPKLKSADAKSFAKMMITDHTKMKNDGAALAKKANITPEMPNMPNEMDKLSSLSGAALDSAYINMSVEDHQKDLNDLQTMQSQAQNADLKAAIEKAIPVVQKHLDRAKELQQKMSGSTATKS